MDPTRKQEALGEAVVPHIKGAGGRGSRATGWEWGQLQLRMGRSQRYQRVEGNMRIGKIPWHLHPQKGLSGIHCIPGFQAVSLLCACSAPS